MCDSRKARAEPSTDETFGEKHRILQLGLYKNQFISKKFGNGFSSPVSGAAGLAPLAALGSAVKVFG
jgi:hypothetical protein